MLAAVYVDVQDQADTDFLVMPMTDHGAFAATIQGSDKGNALQFASAASRRDEEYLSLLCQANVAAIWALLQRHCKEIVRWPSSRSTCRGGHCASLHMFFVRKGSW